MGTVQVKVGDIVFEISDVLITPKCANILSVKNLIDKGFQVTLESISAIIANKNGVQVPLINGLRILPVSNVESYSCLALKTQKCSKEKFYC